MVISRDGGGCRVVVGDGVSLCVVIHSHRRPAKEKQVPSDAIVSWVSTAPEIVICYFHMLSDLSFGNR